MLICYFRSFYLFICLFSCSQLPCTSQPSHPLQLGPSVSCCQGEGVEGVRSLASLHPRTEGMMPTWSPHPAGWSPHLEAGRRNKGDRAWDLPPTCPGLSHERDRDILSFSPVLGDTLLQQQTFALKAKVLYKPLPSCHRKSGLISSHFAKPSSC